MKKKVFIACLVFAFVLFNLNFALAKLCSETDSGVNYYEKGSVTVDTNFVLSLFSIGTHTDECTKDGKTLAEFYCNGEDYGTISYICESGCENGKCLGSADDSGSGVTCVIGETNIKCLGGDSSLDESIDDSLETPENADNKCIDTDRGYGIAEEYIQGQAYINKDKKNLRTDECASPVLFGLFGQSKKLIEYYCSKDSVQKKVINCIGACKDGACYDSLNDVPITPSPSDPIPLTFPYEEYSSGGNSGGDENNPPSENPDLEPVADGCIDTDGGKNYSIEGIVNVTIRGITTTLPDKCEIIELGPNRGREMLREAYCDSNGNGVYEEYACPLGCLRNANICRPTVI